MEKNSGHLKQQKSPLDRQIFMPHQVLTLCRTYSPLRSSTAKNGKGNFFAKKKEKRRNETIRHRSSIVEELPEQRKNLMPYKKHYAESCGRFLIFRYFRTCQVESIIEFEEEMDFFHMLTYVFNRNSVCKAGIESFCEKLIYHCPVRGSSQKQSQLFEDAECPLRYSTKLHSANLSNFLK